MNINRSKQISIQTAQSEAAFLLAWIRCLERHCNSLLFISNRYPLQKETIEFCVKETKKEIIELHEERAYWLARLDEEYLTND